MSEETLSKTITQPETGQASTSNEKLNTKTEPQSVPQVHSALTKATLAQHPFDDSEGSDTILRSADNVDFYVYRAILSVASPVFKARFANIPKVTSDDEAKPIMKVPETSKTLYLLLRICYPVDDQFISSPMTIGDVLEAALKYDIKVAAKTLKKILHKYVTHEPLQVYTVACHLSLEDTASLAAHAWRKTSHHWTDTVTAGDGKLIDLKDTIVGGSYIEEMTKISAGSFFRLTQFVRAGVETSFCEYKDPTSQGDPASAAAAATTTEPTTQTEAPSAASESTKAQTKDSSLKPPTAPATSTPSPFGDIPASTTSGFGASTTSSASLSGLFGGSAAATQSKPPATVTTSSSSLFGDGPFGITSSKAPAAFGASTTSTSSGSAEKPSPFAAPTSSASSSTPSKPATSNPSPFSFGGVSTTTSGSADKPSPFGAPNLSASSNTPSKPAASTSSPFGAAAFPATSRSTYHWFAPSSSSNIKPTTPSAPSFSFAPLSSSGSASASTSTPTKFTFGHVDKVPLEPPATKLPFSFGLPSTKAPASATAVPPNVSSSASTSSGATSASVPTPTPPAPTPAPAATSAAADSANTSTPATTSSAPAPTPSAPAPTPSAPAPESATAPVSPPATPSETESTSDHVNDIGAVEEKLEYDPQFDFDDADLEISSSDGVKFNVHHLILRLASPTLVENVDVGDGEGKMTLSLPESSRTVSILLQGCYPSMTVESGLEMAEMCHALRAAAKYRMAKVVDKLKALLRFTNAAEALSAFITLALNNFVDEATEVACSDVLLFSPLSTLYVPEMEDISAQLYYHLLQHRHGCLAAMYAVGSKYEDDAKLDSKFRNNLQWWSMIRSTRSIDLAMPIVEKQLRQQRDTKVQASSALSLKSIRDESAKLTKEVDRLVAEHDAMLMMNLKSFMDISLPKWLQCQEARALVKSAQASNA